MGNLRKSRGGDSASKQTGEQQPGGPQRVLNIRDSLVVHSP